MTSPTVSSPTTEQVSRALAGVNDPEIRRPITELGMVKNIDISPDGSVRVDVYLTVAGCPLRDTITREVTAAVGAVEGVSRVRVELDVMSDEQRRALQTQLRGGQEAPEIPFSKPTSLTRVFAVASGKGGVGKSSVTVNLAAALAASGAKVGIADADIYGHSVPRMLGVTGTPTQVEKMIMPPTAHGVKVISIGMYLEPGARPAPARARADAQAGPRKPPNIVFIFSDDHAYQAISAYDDPRRLIETPAHRSPGPRRDAVRPLPRAELDLRAQPGRRS